MAGSGNPFVGAARGAGLPGWGSGAGSGGGGRGGSGGGGNPFVGVARGFGRDELGFGRWGSRGAVPASGEGYGVFPSLLDAKVAAEDDGSSAGLRFANAAGFVKGQPKDSYANLAKSWFTGANADGTEPGFSGEFFDAAAASWDRVDRLAKRKGDPTLSFRAWSDPSMKVTGLLPFDTADGRFAAGEVIIDGVSQGNIYDMFDEATADLLLFQQYGGGDGPNGVDQQEVFSSPDRVKRVRGEVAKIVKDFSESAAAAESRFKFGKVEDRVEGGWVDEVAKAAVVTGATVVGGLIGSAVPGFGTAAGASAAGSAAAASWGSAAAGAVLFGGAAALNADEVGRIAVRGKAIADRAGESPWSSGRAASTWVETAGQLGLKAVSPLSNTVRGLEDVAAGGWGDNEVEFQAVDGEGRRKASGVVQALDLVATFGDSFIQFSNPVGVQAYLGSVGLSAVGKAGTAAQGSVFNDVTGRWDDLEGGEHAAAWGDVGVDVVQLGLGRWAAGGAGVTRRAVGASPFARNERVAAWAAAPVSEGRLASSGLNPWRAKSGERFEDFAGRRFFTRESADGGREVVRSMWRPSGLLAPSEFASGVVAGTVARVGAARAGQGVFRRGGESAVERAALRRSRDDLLYKASYDVAVGRAWGGPAIAVTVGSTEGLEEVAQEYLHAWSTSRQPTGDDVRTAFLYGFAGGAGMGLSRMRGGDRSSVMMGKANFIRAARGRELYTSESWDGLSEHQKYLAQQGNEVEERDFGALMRVAQQAAVASEGEEGVLADLAGLNYAALAAAAAERKVATVQPTSVTLIDLFGDNVKDPITGRVIQDLIPQGGYGAAEQIGVNLNSGLARWVEHYRRAQSEIDALEGRKATLSRAEFDRLKALKHDKALLDELFMERTAGDPGSSVFNVIVSRIRELHANIVSAERGSVGRHQAIQAFNKFVRDLSDQRLTDSNGVLYNKTIQSIAFELGWLVDKRYPLLQDGAHHTYVPQISVQLDNDGAQGVLGHNPVAFEVAAADLDGDAKSLEVDWFPLRVDRDRLRAGFQFVRESGEAVKALVWSPALGKWVRDEKRTVPGYVVDFRVPDNEVDSVRVIADRFASTDLNVMAVADQFRQQARGILRLNFPAVHQKQLDLFIDEFFSDLAAGNADARANLYNKLATHARDGLMRDMVADGRNGLVSPLLASHSKLTVLMANTRVSWLRLDQMAAPQVVKSDSTPMRSVKQGRPVADAVEVPDSASTVEAAVFTSQTASDPFRVIVKLWYLWDTSRFPSEGWSTESPEFKQIVARVDELTTRSDQPLVAASRNGRAQLRARIMLRDLAEEFSKGHRDVSVSPTQLAAQLSMMSASQVFGEGNEGLTIGQVVFRRALAAELNVMEAEGSVSDEELARLDMLSRLTRLGQLDRSKPLSQDNSITAWQLWQELYGHAPIADVFGEEAASRFGPNNTVNTVLSALSVNTDANIKQILDVERRSPAYGKHNQRASNPPFSSQNMDVDTTHAVSVGDPAALTPFKILVEGVATLIQTKSSLRDQDDAAMSSDTRTAIEMIRRIVDSAARTRPGLVDEVGGDLSSYKTRFAILQHMLANDPSVGEQIAQMIPEAAALIAWFKQGTDTLRTPDWFIEVLIGDSSPAKAEATLFVESKIAAFMQLASKGSLDGNVRPSEAAAAKTAAGPVTDPLKEDEAKAKLPKVSSFEYTSLKSVFHRGLWLLAQEGREREFDVFIKSLRDAPDADALKRIWSEQILSKFPDLKYSLALYYDDISEVAEEGKSFFDAQPAGAEYRENIRKLRQRLDGMLTAESELIANGLSENILESDARIAEDLRSKGEKSKYHSLVKAALRHAQTVGVTAGANSTREFLANANVVISANKGTTQKEVQRSGNATVAANTDIFGTQLSQLLKQIGYSIDEDDVLANPTLLAQREVELSLSRHGGARVMLRLHTVDGIIDALQHKELIPLVKLVLMNTVYDSVDSETDRVGRFGLSEFSLEAILNGPNMTGLAQDPGVGRVAPNDVSDNSSYSDLLQMISYIESALSKKQSEARKTSSQPNEENELQTYNVLLQLVMEFEAAYRTIPDLKMSGEDITATVAQRVMRVLYYMAGLYSTGGMKDVDALITVAKETREEAHKQRQAEIPDLNLITVENETMEMLIKTVLIESLAETKMKTQSELEKKLLEVEPKSQEAETLNKQIDALDKEIEADAAKISGVSFRNITPIDAVVRKFSTQPTPEEEDARREAIKNVLSEPGVLYSFRDDVQTRQAFIDYVNSGVDSDTLDPKQWDVLGSWAASAFIAREVGFDKLQISLNPLPLVLPERKTDRPNSLKARPTQVRMFDTTWGSLLDLFYNEELLQTVSEMIFDSETGAGMNIDPTFTNASKAVSELFNSENMGSWDPSIPSTSLNIARMLRQRFAAPLVPPGGVEHTTVAGLAALLQTAEIKVPSGAQRSVEVAVVRNDDGSFSYSPDQESALLWADYAYGTEITLIDEAGTELDLLKLTGSPPSRRNAAARGAVTEGSGHGQSVATAAWTALEDIEEIMSSNNPDQEPAYKVLSTDGALFLAEELAAQDELSNGKFNSSGQLRLRFKYLDVRDAPKGEQHARYWRGEGRGAGIYTSNIDIFMGKRGAFESTQQDVLKLAKGEKFKELFLSLLSEDEMLRPGTVFDPYNLDSIIERMVNVIGSRRLHLFQWEDGDRRDLINILMSMVVVTGEDHNGEHAAMWLHEVFDWANSNPDQSANDPDFKWEDSFPLKNVKLTPLSLTELDLIAGDPMDLHQWRQDKSTFNPSKAVTRSGRRKLDARTLQRIGLQNLGEQGDLSLLTNTRFAFMSPGARWHSRAINAPDDVDRALLTKRHAHWRDVKAKADEARLKPSRKNKNNGGKAFFAALDKANNLMAALADSAKKLGFAADMELSTVASRSVMTKLQAAMKESETKYGFVLQNEYNGKTASGVITSLDLRKDQFADGQGPSYEDVAIVLLDSYLHSGISEAEAYKTVARDVHELTRRGVSIFFSASKETDLLLKQLKHEYLDSGELGYRKAAFGTHYEPQTPGLEADANLRLAMAADSARPVIDLQKTRATFISGHDSASEGSTSVTGYNNRPVEFSEAAAQMPQNVANLFTLTDSVESGVSRSLAHKAHTTRGTVAAWLADSDAVEKLKSEHYFGLTPEERAQVETLEQLGTLISFDAAVDRLSRDVNEGKNAVLGRDLRPGDLVYTAAPRSDEVFFWRYGFEGPRFEDNGDVVLVESDVDVAPAAISAARIAKDQTLPFGRVTDIKSSGRNLLLVMEQPAGLFGYKQAIGALKTITSPASTLGGYPTAQPLGVNPKSLMLDEHTNPKTITDKYTDDFVAYDLKIAALFAGIDLRPVLLKTLAGFDIDAVPPSVNVENLRKAGKTAEANNLYLDEQQEAAGREWLKVKEFLQHMMRELTGLSAEDVYAALDGNVFREAFSEALGDSVLAAGLASDVVAKIFDNPAAADNYITAVVMAAALDPGTVNIDDIVNAPGWVDQTSVVDPLQVKMLPNAITKRLSALTLPEVRKRVVGLLNAKLNIDSGYFDTDFAYHKAYDDGSGSPFFVKGHIALLGQHALADSRSKFYATLGAFDGGGQGRHNEEVVRATRGVEPLHPVKSLWSTLQADRKKLVKKLGEADSLDVMISRLARSAKTESVIAKRNAAQVEWEKQANSAKQQYLIPAEIFDVGGDSDPEVERLVDDILSELTGQTTQLRDNIKMSARKIVGSAAAKPGETNKNIGVMSRDNMLFALGVIKENVANGLFTSARGFVFFEDASLVEEIFRLNQKRENGTKVWRPKKSSQVGAPVEYAESDDLTSWLQAALGQAFTSEIPMFKEYLAANDGFMHEYRSAQRGFMGGPVSMSIELDERLMDRDTGAYLDSLDRLQQAALGREVVGELGAMTTAALIGLDNYIDYTKAGTSAESAMSDRIELLRKWHKSKDIATPIPVTVENAVKDGFVHAHSARTRHNTMNTLLNISVANRLFDPNIWMGGLVEVPVRSFIERATVKLDRPEGAPDDLTNIANRVMEVDVEATRELTKLLALAEEAAGDSEALIGELIGETTYQSTVADGGSKWLSRAAEKAARFSAAKTDALYGVRQGRSMGQAYLSGVLYYYSSQNIQVDIKLLLANIQRDPMYLKKNASREGTGFRGGDAHAAGIKQVAQRRGMAKTVASEVALAPIEWGKQSNHAAVAIGSHLINIAAPFMRFNINGLLLFSGLGGLDAVAAAALTGRHNPRWLQRLRAGIKGESFQYDENEFFDLSDTMDAMNLSRAFMRSQVSFGSVLLLGMAMGGLGVTGEDDEMRRRRRLANQLGHPVWHDPRDIANDFRNPKSTWYLDEIPFLSQLFVTKTADGEEHSMVTPVWWVEQFTAPVMGIAKFLESGQLSDIVGGFSRAFSVIPNGVVRLFKDADAMAMDLYKQEEAAGTFSGNSGSVDQLTKFLVTFTNIYGAMLTENNFINSIVSMNDLERDAWAVAEFKNGKYVLGPDGQPVQSSELTNSIDPVTNEIIKTYETNSAERAMWMTYAEDHVTFRMLMALGTGKLGDSPWLRRNMVPYKQKIDRTPMTEEQMKSLVMRVWEDSTANQPGHMSYTPYEAERVLRDRQMRATGSYWGNDAKIGKAVLSVVENGQEKPLDAGAMAVMRGLFKGTLDIDSPALQNFYIPYEMRARIQGELFNELVVSALELGVPKDVAYKRASRLWYGHTKEHPEMLGLRDILSSTKIPTKSTIEYNQLETTNVIGPDGLPWSTGFQRSTLFSFLGVPIKPVVNTKDAMNIGGNLNSIDELLSINTGLRALVRVPGEEIKLPDIEIPDLTGDDDSSSSGGSGYRRYGGYRRRGGGYRRRGGGGGGGYPVLPKVPRYEDRRAFPTLRVPYTQPIPSISGSNPNVRRGSIRREKTSSQRGRLKQWQ